MRSSAAFPAGDTSTLKKKLVFWAGNFSSAILIDRNGYKAFDPSRELLFACGEDSHLVTRAGVFSPLKEYWNEKKDWLFGYLSYDLKNETEPKAFTTHTKKSDGIGFPLAHFFQPEHVVELKNGALHIHSTKDPAEVFESISTQEIPDHENAPISNTIHQRMDESEYISIVEKLQSHILNGDLYEVNFCQEFFVENFTADPFTLFNRLNILNPSPAACFVKHGDRFLLCSSPERFLKKTGNRITSQPIKGTIARNGFSDEAAREKLFHDPKERAENVMIVDLMRNDLSRSAISGSVKVDELFGIYSYRNLHHMISTISSTLRHDVHFIDALKFAFPMGSMTGAPKVMAMQLIDKYEKTQRGLFSGAVGFITPEGDFDFNVVIRSLLYNAASQFLSFQAGSAITYDSVPEKEYAECLLKAQSLFDSLR
jgi:para-aminobenzoate synthetase component 1